MKSLFSNRYLRNLAKVSCATISMMFGVLMIPSTSLWAQPETDIYLATLTRLGDQWELKEPQNITQNPGYDNQPFFTEDGRYLIYAGTRSGQTDIARYELGSGATTWLTQTPGGSEYSPQQVPGKDAISAIRLDTTGLQRLYEYLGDHSSVLLPELKVGYQVWVNRDLLVCTVLREDRMDLVVARPGFKTAYTYQRYVGRSLSRIPQSDRISFTSREEQRWNVQSMDPLSGATDPIVTLPEGVQDICWLPDGSLVCGVENQLMRYMPGTDTEWQAWHRFDPGMGKISRLAVHPKGKQLALVVQKSKAP